MKPLLVAALATLAGTGTGLAETAEDHYASGWPISLAEAACAGDEGCLTKLAGCGPEDESCAAGVSICEVRHQDNVMFYGPCQTDRVAGPAGSVVLTHIPPEDEAGFHALFFAADGFGSVNGRPARIAHDGCLTARLSMTHYCVTPLSTQEDFARWAKVAEP